MITRFIRKEQVEKPDLRSIEERLSAVELNSGIGQIAAQITEHDTSKFIAHGYKVQPIVTVVKDNGGAGMEEILCNVQYVSDTMVAVSWNENLKFNGWVFLR